MELFSSLAELFLHIDRHLIELATTHPTAVYLVLFLVVFCETGLVIMPFLPGDSLLFAAGTLAGIGALHAGDSFLLLTAAAIAGDGVNYWAGTLLGPRVFSGRVRFLNPKHLEQTYRFYERHGRKTIVMARFVPIVRTFAPFVAGMGRMHYVRFLASNAAGGVLWVGLCMAAGYVWGNQPFVKDNFGLVVVGIVAVSILPAFAQFALRRFRQLAWNASFRD